MSQHKIYSVFTWKEYLLFFNLNVFVVSCNFVLFFNFYMKQQNSFFFSALIIFGNILFISLICVFFYGLWHKCYVERPVKKILAATNAVAAGNFSVQINEGRNNIMRFNEFDQIISNFNLMTKELSGTETLRSDLIANVTHELKTPLAAIQNYATLLQSPQLTPEAAEEYTNAIISRSKQLSELITNILKLNKLENQQIFPEINSYDLSEQIAECILTYEHACEQKQIDIDTDIEEDVTICADQSLLVLVWNNLLSNAVKFTPQKGRISISLHAVGEEIAAVITDTGIGMDEHTLQHIFDKFYQGDTSHAMQGNGLGLALAKRVIDICHGTITVSSTPGKGTSFTVRLPAKQDH